MSDELNTPLKITATGSYHIEPREGWTTWIPFALMECHLCSALVPGNGLATQNHEEWHRLHG